MLDKHASTRHLQVCSTKARSMGIGFKTIGQVLSLPSKSFFFHIQVKRYCTGKNRQPQFPWEF